MCYAFVCRAALGPSPFVTKDGQKDVKGRRLFEDHTKSSLTLGKHALVAEAGGDDHLVHRSIRGLSNTKLGHPCDLYDQSHSHAHGCATHASAHSHSLTRYLTPPHQDTASSCSSTKTRSISSTWCASLVRRNTAVVTHGDLRTNPAAHRYGRGASLARVGYPGVLCSRVRTLIRTPIPGNGWVAVGSLPCSRAASAP